MESQMYEVTTCPLCGQLMFNGECENPDCRYHWHPMEDDERARLIFAAWMLANTTPRKASLTESGFTGSRKWRIR